MQLDLFRKARRPPKRNPRTLFVIDAGLPGPGDRCPIRLKCDACGHETRWLPGRAIAIEQKGRVCPVCKGDVTKVQGVAS